MTERYLEDFEAGQSFRSGRIRIDADRIERFATEFDPQAFHLDQNNEPVQVFVGNLIGLRRPASSGEWHV